MSVAFALGLAALAGSGLGAAPQKSAAPQQNSTTAQQQAPQSRFLLRKPFTGPGWFHGEVIAMTGAAITVRDRKNERMIRTFTYAPELKERMQGLLDRGGYQYGDKVAIRFKPPSNVALAVKGKPSKSAL